jgi:peptide deformylase
MRHVRRRFPILAAFALAVCGSRAISASSGSAEALTQVLRIDVPAQKAILTARSRTVNLHTDELAPLLASMERIVRQRGAGGLAAVQLGVPQRIVVLRRSESNPATRFQAMLNPIVVGRSGELLASWEHCLSVPWGYRYTERADAITVRYSAPDGRSTTETLRGGDAAVLQHELDHLEGVLLSDGLSPRWFIPDDHIDAFAAQAGQDCRNHSSKPCRARMKKRWIDHAR